VFDANRDFLKMAIIIPNLHAFTFYQHCIMENFPTSFTAIYKNLGCA
jgi:hypothetical protein